MAVYEKSHSSLLKRYLGALNGLIVVRRYPKLPMLVGRQVAAGPRPHVIPENSCATSLGSDVVRRIELAPAPLEFVRIPQTGNIMHVVIYVCMFVAVLGPHDSTTPFLSATAIRHGVGSESRRRALLAAFTMRG